MTMLSKLFCSALMRSIVFLSPCTALANEAELKNTPFAYGEQVPELTASCENIAEWSHKSPSGDMRIDLAIQGTLSEVSFDGVLAYLTMCGRPGTTVTCVTYSTNGMAAGDAVRFGGGFALAGADRIVLDPCLASREE